MNLFVVAGVLVNFIDSKCLAAKNNMDLGLDIADDLAKVEFENIFKNRHLKIW